MQIHLSILPLLILYLLSINFLLKKFNISLDKEATHEKHKSLLRKGNTTPLSGMFYFLPIILIFTNDLSILVKICCSLFFILGFLADVKIINSYKLRLVFQFLFLSILFFITKDIIIDTRLSFINNLMNYDLTRILLCTFFFMVLINGFNLIDGTNCLCTLNLLIVSIFLFLLINNLNIDYMINESKILIIALSIFVLFNFFGKNFLGDGAVYGLSFVFGYILLKISIINNNISPYFIANLLWYPAFENLFSILRRNFSNMNNYLPDNEHMHQLIFKFYKKKKTIKKDFLLSSMIGICINLILFVNYSIGFLYYNHTITQVVLIVGGIFLYLIFYYSFKKKLS